jgi:hypothetical protein
LSTSQLIQEGDAQTIRIEGYRGTLDDEALSARVTAALAAHGARPARVTIEHVGELP